MYSDNVIADLKPPSFQNRIFGKGNERYSRQVDELDYIVPRGGYYFEVHLIIAVDLIVLFSSFTSHLFLKQPKISKFMSSSVQHDDRDVWKPTRGSQQQGDPLLFAKGKIANHAGTKLSDFILPARDAWVRFA